MLIGLDPRLNPDVLHALAAMGHGDTVVITDTNFPADSLARKSAVGKLLRMDGITAAQAVEAILSVFPLDTMDPGYAAYMEADGPMPPVHQEVQSIVDATLGQPSPMESIERFAFYGRAETAYAVIQSGERRFFGNYVLRKGIVAPDA